MMGRLKQILLGNAARVLSGYAFKSETFSSEGIPVVKIGNIQNGTVVFDPRLTECIPKEIAAGIHSKFWIRRGEILVSLTGSHMTQPGSVVGRVAQYQNSFSSLLNQRAGKVIISN